MTLGLPIGGNASADLGEEDSIRVADRKRGSVLYLQSISRAYKFRDLGQKNGRLSAAAVSMS